MKMKQQILHLNCIGTYDCSICLSAQANGSSHVMFHAFLAAKFLTTHWSVFCSLESFLIQKIDMQRYHGRSDA